MFENDNGVSWQEKKKAILERLSKSCETNKSDRAKLKAAREGLLSEVKRLEEENNAMARDQKELQRKILEKRTMAQMLFKRTDDLKRKGVRLACRENSLLQEIRFLSAEKQGGEDRYREISKRIDTYMSAVAHMVKNIDFMKGEMGTLMEKVGLLERDVPIKFQDADHLDEKIESALQALTDLYDKMRAIERNGKVSYYKKGRHLGAIPNP